jgi:hypothetical protein
MAEKYRIVTDDRGDLMEIDQDIALLLHSAAGAESGIHDQQVKQLRQSIVDYVQRSQSDPDIQATTVGLFGPWGSGKSTLLARVADKLQQHYGPNDGVRVVYFNAWRYSDATDLVPAFVYKLLRYGFAVNQSNSELIGRVIFALGSKYADTLGEWAKHFLGLNPIDVFRDLSELKEDVEKAKDPTAKIAEDYYCRVDQVRDMLQEIAANAKSTVIALIDEIDRCDPDEAFAMLKELRVFFSMRQMPLFMIIAANPDPIGLAIKHKYGLDSAGSDYEARRILEKFVDRYVDLSETVYLGQFVRDNLSRMQRQPSCVSLAAAVDLRVSTDLSDNVVFNSTQFDAITSRNPYYGNLRVLRKSMESAFAYGDLPWTRWHLDLASQLDTKFRSQLASTSIHVSDAVKAAYRALRENVPVEHFDERGKSRLQLSGTQEKTVFAFLRSRIWETMREVVKNVERVDSPDARYSGDIVRTFLEDRRKMDFIVNLGMVPFGKEHEVVSWRGGRFGEWVTDDMLEKVIGRRLGFLLASY